MINLSDVLKGSPKNTANLFAVYKRHLLQATILETLVTEGPINIKNITKMIIKKSRHNHTIMWKTNVGDVDSELIYLHKLGLMNVDVEQTNQIIIDISEDGKTLLRSGATHNIAYTAFSNYKLLTISILSLIISLVSAFIAIIALYRGK